MRCITDTITDDNVAELAGQKRKLDMAWTDSGWNVNISERPLIHSPQLVPARSSVSDEINGYKSIFKKLHRLGHFPLKAVIIYENFTGAMQATSALRQIAASMAVDVDWHLEAWRLDMLKFPPTEEKALDEAEPAHLVLIANLAIPSLPIWLKNWLERWASLRQIRHAALAILHDETTNDSSVRLPAELSKVASQCGLNFVGKIKAAQQPGRTGLSQIAPKQRPGISRKRYLSIFGKKSGRNHDLTIDSRVGSPRRRQTPCTLHARTQNQELI